MIYFHGGCDSEAKALIEQYHYSHRMPDGILAVGTFHLDGGLFGDKGEAIAACVFCNSTARWNEEVIELIRLVRKDNIQVPLTKLIALTLKLIKRQGYDLVISYADKEQNHHGGIYQAASWFYNGERESRMDGLIVNGIFYPGRTCNALWNTQSPKKLKVIKPKWDIQPHYDKCKHLYWKPLSHKGKLKAERLGLKKATYPKPRMVTTHD